MKAHLTFVSFLLACSTPSPTPTSPVASQAPAGAAPAATSDEGFHATATEVATALGARVNAWGTAELDEQPGPDRWAQINNADGGAYLVEAGRSLFLVQHVMGKTLPWRQVPDEVKPGAPAPVWEKAPDKWIAHTEGHTGGYDRYDFAVRAGQIVLLHEETVGDKRDGDKPVRIDHADANGVCAKPCPKLGEVFRVLGPAATVAELHVTPWTGTP